ncbi:MAG: hypothetical protein GY730_06710 [bacterium]|nr:hypothetical protein [bacterium]
MKPINQAMRLQKIQSMLKQHGHKQQAESLKLYRARTESLKLLKELSAQAIEPNRQTKTIRLNKEKLHKAWKVLDQMRKLNMRIDVDYVREVLLEAIGKYQKQGYTPKY